jgi:hypothetical protein
MTHFELIDDYLASRLKGADKEAFESQLANDPALKSEVELQRQIIEGIKQARAAELKAMLSRVPVTAGGAQVEFSVLRIAAGVILAGVVTAAIYYYYNPSKFPPIDNAAADVTQKDKVIPKENQPESSIPQPDKDQLQPAPTPDKQEDGKEKQKSNDQAMPAVTPKLDVVDPSADLEGNEKPVDNQAAQFDKQDISPAHVQVQMDSSNKKYPFHYQFSDSRLMLYGSFDRSLYEVLEINSNDHSLFLYYKNNFYLLDETQEEITKLTPIQDKELLKKLKAYRSR